MNAPENLILFLQVLNDPVYTIGKSTLSWLLILVLNLMFVKIGNYEITGRSLWRNLAKLK